MAAVGAALPYYAAIAASPESVLHAFGKTAEAPYDAFPAGDLTADAKGDLYGITAEGTVFKLSPPIAPQTSWTYARIYSFSLSAPTAFSALAVAPDGTIYGGFGGDIFKLSLSGSTWTETDLTQTGICAVQHIWLVSSGAIYFTGYQSFPPASGLSEASPPNQGQYWNVTSLATVTNGGPLSAAVADTRGNYYAIATAASFGPYSSPEQIVEFSPPTGGSSTWTTNAPYVFPSGTTTVRST